MAAPSGGAQISVAGTLALLLAATAWAAGSLYVRRAPLPRRPLRSSSMQMLCGGAMLLVRTYRALDATSLGFSEPGALTVRVSLPLAEYPQRAARLAFHEALTQRVRALPGVVRVGSAQGIPFSGWNLQ